MIGKKHKSNHPAVKGVPIRKRTAKWSGKRQPAVTHDRPREEYKSKWNYSLELNQSGEAMSESSSHLLKMLVMYQSPLRSAK